MPVATVAVIRRNASGALGSGTAKVAGFLTVFAAADGAAAFGSPASRYLVAPSIPWKKNEPPDSMFNTRLTACSKSEALTLVPSMITSPEVEDVSPPRM